MQEFGFDPLNLSPFATLAYKHYRNYVELKIAVAGMWKQASRETAVTRSEIDTARLQVILLNGVPTVRLTIEPLLCPVDGVDHVAALKRYSAFFYELYTLDQKLDRTVLHLHTPGHKASYAPRLYLEVSQLVNRILFHLAMFEMTLKLNETKILSDPDRVHAAVRKRLGCKWTNLKRDYITSYHRRARKHLVKTGILPAENPSHG